MSQAPVLTARLQAKDETSKTLKGVTKSFTSTFKDIAKAAAGFLVADVAKSFVRVGKESIGLGGEIETLQKAFDALKGDVDDTVLSADTLKDAVDDTVSEIDLLTAANNAMALGLPTEDLNELFEAARLVGAAMGRDALDAVRDLTTGIGRQSKLILDNLGIIVNTEEAYQSYADTLGKSINELTNAERKTAFMTAAIDALNDKAATLEGTLSETTTTQQQFAAMWTDIKTRIGTLLIPVVSDLMAIIVDTMDVVLDFIDMAKEGDWEGIVSVVTEAFSGLKNAIFDIIGAIDWVQVFQGLGTFIADIPFLIAEALFGLGMILGQVIDETDWNEVFSGLWNAWSNFIGSLATRLVENVLNLLPQWIQDLFTSATAALPPANVTPNLIPNIEAAKGFRGIVSSPTTFTAGEAGAEMVNISPLTSGGGGGGGGDVNIHIGNFIGLDEPSTRRNLAAALAEFDVGELLRRGIRP